MFKNKPSYVEFLEGILIGGSLAAVASFVFGTKRGKKLQQQILAKYKKIEHKAGHYVHKVEKAAKSPVAKKLKRMVNKAVKKTAARKMIRSRRRKSTTKAR